MQDKISSIEMYLSKYINKLLKIMMAPSLSEIISIPYLELSKYCTGRLVIQKDSCSTPPIHQKGRSIKGILISSLRILCSSIEPSTYRLGTEIVAQGCLTLMVLLTGPPERFRMSPILPDWTATKEVASSQLNPLNMKNQGLSKSLSSFCSWLFSWNSSSCLSSNLSSVP